MKYSHKRGKSIHKKKHSTVNKTRKSTGYSMSGKNLVLKYMLQMLMTVKLYHWNTFFYSVHKATDELYNELNILIDQFVEVLLGKHDNIGDKNKGKILNIKSVPVNNYTDDGDFKKEMELYKKFLIGLEKHVNPRDNSDLFSIRYDILSVLNKTSYLLKFI